MIKVSDLIFEYRQHDSAKRVLNGIDLLIREGERIGLMGPNGCGKTTLARCLNGLRRPTSGKVEVDGFDTRDAARLSEVRRRVGMVFQNPENQIVSTTVEREIAFGLENLGVPHADMHPIVDRMLRQFNLEKYRHHPPHLLSGGEMQRLALASIMAMSPKYLIFDEPTSLLDLPSRKLVLALVSQLHAQNHSTKATEQLATVLVTQYPEEMLTCHRLLIMHQGRIILDDRPSEIFQNVDELQKIGVDVPVEYEVNHYLKEASAGRISLNPADFLPIP